MRLDLDTKKWESLNEMRVGKTFSCSAFLHDNYIYKIGGNEKDYCERYDLENDMWESIPTYADVTSI